MVQLDCDHVPDSSYLAAMVRPFAAPKSGTPVAPSICDSNADMGWTVRGRLYREATLHGPMQAGANDGYAPCASARTTQCARPHSSSVGGLGPELAEDYSTTLWLQSGGWDGVFVLDAEAHGAGPISVDELLTQESQWARSLGTLLTKWLPGRVRGVPWRGRVRMGFSLFFYLVMGVMLTVATVLPVMGVLLRQSWGHTSLVDFYTHMWAYSLLVLGTAYLRAAPPRLQASRCQALVLGGDPLSAGAVALDVRVLPTGHVLRVALPHEGFQSDPEGHQRGEHAERALAAAHVRARSRTGLGRGPHTPEGPRARPGAPVHRGVRHLPAGHAGDHGAASSAELPFRRLAAGAQPSRARARATA